MASLISESLAGARVAKTYGLEGYLKGRVATAFDEIRRLKMKAANARGRLDPLLEAGGGVAVAAVLILIGWRILDGRSTVGDFTGFVSALILAAQPIRALGNLNAIVQEAGAALKRTFAMMDEAPEIRERPEAAALAVDARRDPLRARPLPLSRRRRRARRHRLRRAGGEDHGARSGARGPASRRSCRSCRGSTTSPAAPS